ncbi:MAG: hypothetical protein ACE3JK_08985 [Sporolactobacillus sp.]
MPLVTINLIELAAGLLINLLIGKLQMILFRKKTQASRVIIRVIGVFLLVDGLLGILHIHLF